MSKDRDPLWDALKAHSKEKFNTSRQQALTEAQQEDDGQWTKHTEFHWSRDVQGKRLDYWPSRKKFQYDGNVQRGDVMAFIREKSPKPAAPAATHFVYTLDVAIEEARGRSGTETACQREHAQLVAWLEDYRALCVALNRSPVGEEIKPMPEEKPSKTISHPEGWNDPQSPNYKPPWED